MKNFLENSSNKQSETAAVLETLLDSYGNHCQTTKRFLNVLNENKRTSALKRIAETYLDYYKLLNKEESVRVISATELTEDQRSRVLSTLEGTNEGAVLTMSWEVDPTILGGLHIYRSNTFL